MKDYFKDWLKNKSELTEEEIKQAKENSKKTELKIWKN